MKYFRKITSLITLALVCNILCVSYSSAYSNPMIPEVKSINITFNGTPIQFRTGQNDPKPYIKQGRILVPFRKIFETIGMEILWNAFNQTITARNESLAMDIRIGNKIASVNRMEKELDVAAEITGGRTFVPLRFVSENCGIKVEWDSRERTVRLTWAVVPIPSPLSEVNPTTAALPTATPAPTVFPETTPTAVTLHAATQVPIVSQETNTTASTLSVAVPAFVPLLEATSTSKPNTVTPEPVLPTPAISPVENISEPQGSSEKYFNENEILLKRCASETSVEKKLVFYNSSAVDAPKDTVLLDMNGVDESYQGEAILAAKYLNRAIRVSDREFDFGRAAELVKQRADMAVAETLNENVSQNNIDVDVAVDRLQDLIHARIGLTFTSEIRSQIREIVNSTFNSRYTAWRDDDGIGDLKWTKEKREEGQGSYFKMYFGIKNKDTDNMLYIIPFNVYVTCSKYEVSKYFGLKKETKYSSNINVQALKISKLL